MNKKITALLIALSTSISAGYCHATLFKVVGESIYTFNGPYTFSLKMNGMYDDTTGNGSWEVQTDASPLFEFPEGRGSAQWEQTWTIDSEGETAIMNFPTNCSGDLILCSVVGSVYGGVGYIYPSALTGPGIYGVLLPLDPRSVRVDMTLVQVPNPAAALLFGSALLGVVGVKRIRRRHSDEPGSSPIYGLYFMSIEPAENNLHPTQNSEPWHTALN